MASSPEQPGGWKGRGAGLVRSAKAALLGAWRWVKSVVRDPATRAKVRSALSKAIPALRTALRIVYQETLALFNKGPRADGTPPLRRVQRWWYAAWPPVQQVLRFANDDRSGLAAAAVVLVVALLITTLGWIPLSLPARYINIAVAYVSVSSCPDGSTYGICSAVVSVFSLAGPIVVMLLMFIFRFSIKRVIQRWLTRLPNEARFLVPPTLATILFTMGWAGVSFHFFTRPGVVIDGLFPAAVGMLTYVTVRYGPQAQRALSAYFERRDEFSFKVRLITTFAAPAIFAFAVSSFMSSPVRDQVVVVFAIVAGYLLIAPRSGELASVLDEAPAAR